MTVETTTFNGWPLGSNLNVNSDEIPEGYGRYLQDILLDSPGIARQRGPVLQINTGSGATRRPIGLTGTYSRGGVFRVMLVETSGTGGFVFSVFNPPYTAAATFNYGPTLTGYLSAASDAWVFDSKPALGGGVLIGMQRVDAPRSEPDGSTIFADILFLWLGAGKTDYSTGTLTSVLYNSQTVTGSGTTWVGNVEPGMFVFDKTTASGSDGLGRFIGVVKSVETNTSLTLDRVAPYSAGPGLTYVITPFRRVNSIHSKKPSRGFITCASGQTGVTGSDTAFVDDGLVGNYSLYRASDGALIGSVTSVQGQRGLTLTGAANISMDNEEYIALSNLNGGSQYMLGVSSWANEQPVTGFLNAVWQGQQWYANRAGISNKGHTLSSRLWVNREGGGILDSISYSDTDGSFFDIESLGNTSPIKALSPSESMLLVMKEDDTFGISGTDIDSYQADRILNDGALSPMTVVPFENGSVWAGKKGIYLFDGRQIENITADSLGVFYHQIAQSMNLTTRKAWAFIDRNHYFLHLERVNIPTGFGVVKGSAGETWTGNVPLTICVNLETKAVTFMRNLLIRGAVRLPAVQGGQVLYLVEKYTAGQTISVICQSSDLFADTTTQDNVACVLPDGSVSADTTPDFYLEARLEEAGDEELRKLWKMLMIWHWNEGGTMTVDVVKGLGNDYSTSGTTLNQTTVALGTGFQNQRIKFLKRAQYLGFRIYKTGGTIVGTQTTFDIPATTDDGSTFGSGGAYPPAFSSGTNNAQADIIEKSQTGGPTFTLRNGLYRWDTSSIPDNAVISLAQVKFWFTAKTSTDARTLQGDYYASSNWPIDVTDGANMTSVGTAFSAALSAITAGALNTFTLNAPDVNINKTGYTGLRLGVDGGSPSGVNTVSIASSDNVSGNPKPQLVLTYSYSNVTTTRVKLGAWALGFKRQRAGRV